MMISFRRVRCCYRSIDQKTVCMFFRGMTQTKPGVLDSVYSEEEKRKILDSFNHCSETELVSTRLFNRLKSSAIIKYRDQKGNFDSLNSLLSVPGIGLLGLQKACNFLKKMEAKDFGDLLVKTENIQVYPHLTETKQQEVESILALDIQGDRVTWARVNRDLTVDAWNQSFIFSNAFLKYDHVLFHNSVKSLLEKLPNASIYVLENKIYRHTNIRAVPFITNLRILEAIIVTMLNGQDKNRVHMMKPQVLSKFYNLSVGGERVSGKHVIQDIISKKSPVAEGVVLPPELVNIYSKHDSVQQDKFASCLLLAIAVYKLIILKAVSIPI